MDKPVPLGISNYSHRVFVLLYFIDLGFEQLPKGYDTFVTRRQMLLRSIIDRSSRLPCHVVLHPDSFHLVGTIRGLMRRRILNRRVFRLLDERTVSGFEKINLEEK